MSCGQLENLTFRNGAFEHANIGLRLRDISVDANFDDTAIYLARSSASGLDGGDLSARGDFYLDPALNSNLFIDLDNLVVVDRLGQKLQVSGRAIAEKAEARRKHYRGPDRRSWRAGHHENLQRPKHQNRPDHVQRPNG